MIPTQNLKFLLRADMNATPSQWLDQSGNNINFAQGDTNSQPSLVSFYNSARAVFFDNGQHYAYEGTALDAWQQGSYTLMFLLSSEAVARPYPIFWGRGGVTDRFSFYQDAASISRIFGTNTGFISREKGQEFVRYTSTQTPYVVTYTFEKQAGNQGVERWRVNGLACAGQQVTLGNPPTGTPFCLGRSLGAGDTFFSGKIGMVAGFTGVLSGQNLRDAEAEFLRYGGLPAPSRTYSQRVRLFCIGDSITENVLDDDALSYEALLSARLLDGVKPPVIVNLGQGGQPIFNMADKTAQAVAYADHEALNIVTVWGGTNDGALYGKTASQTYDALKARVAELRAGLPSGSKIVVVTMLPRGLPGFRGAYNTLIRDGFASGDLGADLVLDMGADSIMGGENQNVAPLYGIDAVHPTGQGNDHIASRLYEVIQPLTGFAPSASDLSNDSIERVIAAMRLEFIEFANLDAKVSQVRSRVIVA